MQLYSTVAVTKLFLDVRHRTKPRITEIAMTLWSLFLNNNKRTIHKWKHYFPIYEQHFERFVNRPCLMIEIGCGKGGSLQLWKSYLGPHAQIVGLDINPDCRAFEEDQIAIRIGDQSDPQFLGSVIEEFGTPDIVLDDGSHHMQHMLASFSFLYGRTSPTGVYMVEDLHTAYWPDFGGGLRREGSFIETAKGLIDELNADHARGALAPTEFTRSTLSMHFYDSVCVFERGRHLLKSAPQIGLSSHEDNSRAERDQAQMERNAAIKERDAALAQRDAVVEERDAALAERNRVVEERDTAIADRDVTASVLAAVKASSSWRITAPARRIVQALKR